MSESPAEPDFLAVRCRHCDASLRVRARLAGQSTNCPNCREVIQIPMQPTIETILAEDPEPATASADDAGEYRLAVPLLHEPDDGQPLPLPKELLAPLPERGYLDQVERVRSASAPVVESVPQYVFFTGVFDFPWYPEVWPRWVYLVIGGIAASLIPMLAISIFQNSHGYTGVVLAFFAMPQIWISFWSGSFAAACGMQVFEDTAAGSNHITGWPDPNWRDWMWPLMYLGYVALMVLAMAYGIGLACGGQSSSMLWALGLAEFFLFPICLLSVLETNNMTILLSPRLLLTIVQKPISWLLFYLISGVLVAVWGGLLWFTLGVAPWLTVIVNGLLYASISLVWFRLLGRLAWSISHSQSRKKKRVTERPIVSPSPQGESAV